MTNHAPQPDSPTNQRTNLPSLSGSPISEKDTNHVNPLRFEQIPYTLWVEKLQELLLTTQNTFNKPYSEVILNDPNIINSKLQIIQQTLDDLQNIQTESYVIDDGNVDTSIQQNLEYGNKLKQNFIDLKDKIIDVQVLKNKSIYRKIE